MSYMATTSLTPAQIDNVIADVQQQFVSVTKRTEYLKNDKGDRQFIKAQAESIRRDAFKALHAVEVLYQGWQRWYLVNNANGHLHTSTSCSTLHPTTSLSWLPELSGQNPEDVVLTFGETVCTVCVPEAPVYKGFEDGSSDLAIWAKAVKDAEQAEKAAKKKAADDASITVTVANYGGTARPKTFKSERAAYNFASGEIDSIISYGGTHPRNDQWVANVQALAEAGVDVEKALENKIKAHRREVKKFEPIGEFALSKDEYSQKIEAGIATATTVVRGAQV